MAQPRLPGFDNSLGPVSDLQFVKNVGNMVADCFGADVESLGNFLIVFSLGDELKHVTFTVG